MVPVTTWTPAGDPGQALGCSFGLELELDQFNQCKMDLKNLHDLTLNLSRIGVEYNAMIE